VDVPGRGARRVVPSPPPLEIVEIAAIRALADAGQAVVAGGGGGIPVARSGGSLVGVEGVIDKDRTASLIARTLDSPGLVILTEVGHASKGFGTKDETPLLELSVDDARKLLAAGEFPPGSMGPKIEAAADYAEAMGRMALITCVDALENALAGSDGTRIQPG
jgi:carbamate kinase